MSDKRYRQLKGGVLLFVSILVLVAVVRGSFLLTLAALFTGGFFMFLVRKIAHISTDERELAVQEKAARLTYFIFAPTLILASFFLLLPAYGNLEVMSKGEWLFIESLGLIFAYLSLFLLLIYAIVYHFLNHHFGGGHDEE